MMSHVSRQLVLALQTNVTQDTTIGWFAPSKCNYAIVAGDLKLTRALY